MSRPRQYADTIETDRIRARDRKRTERARHRNTAVGVTETLPEPYYQDDWVTLYHGDCTALLPLLLPASVDLVLTDPPYETESHTNQRRVRGVGNGVQVKPIAFVPISDALRAVAARELARIARRWVLTFSQLEGAMIWRDAYARHGLRYWRSCIWDKPDGCPQFNGLGPGMGYEIIVCMTHKTGWNGGGKRGVYRSGTDRNGYDHDTVKPLKLIRELITDFSNPGELVLDPFAGSGTTLVAAKQLNRRAIGIELNARYCKLAANRLRRAEGNQPAQWDMELTG